MPIVRMNPAMPRQRHGPKPGSRHHAEEDHEVYDHSDNRVDPQEFVVREHEHHHQREAREGSRDASADRIPAERRTYNASSR